ncbi:MAG: hypothetical protein ACE5FK_05675 [Candidatus Methylomirabilia bacterium]
MKALFIALVIVGAFVAVFDLSGGWRGQVQHALPVGYGLPELPVVSEVEVGSLPMGCRITL